VTPSPVDAIMLVIVLLGALLVLIIAGPDRVADFLGQTFDAIGRGLGRLGRGIRRVVITTARRVRARFRRQPEVRETIAYAEPAVRRMFFPHAVPTSTTYDNENGSVEVVFRAASERDGEQGMSLMVVEDLRKGDVVGTVSQTRVMFAPEGTAADAPLDEWGVAGLATSVEVNTTHHEPAYLEWGDPGPRPWASSVTVDLPELSPELWAWATGSPTLNEASPDQPQVREWQSPSLDPLVASSISAATRRSFDEMHRLWEEHRGWRAHLRSKPEPKPMLEPSLWDVAPFEPIHHVTKEATVPKNKPTRRDLKDKIKRLKRSANAQRIVLDSRSELLERETLHRQQLEREYRELQMVIDTARVTVGRPVAFHKAYGPSPLELELLALGRITKLRDILGMSDLTVDYRGPDANG
jgi:hypothetical protein